MARRKTQDPEPSLFPFLSVLAAVMGTLVLIIAGMSKIALASPRQRIELDTFDPSKKSPIYVECRAEGLRIYPDNPAADTPIHVDRFNITSPTGPWAELVSRLSRAPNRYLLLLVRSDGIKVFHEARESVSGTGIDVGYEPLFGKGEVLFHPGRRR